MLILNSLYLILKKNFNGRYINARVPVLMCALKNTFVKTRVPTMCIRMAPALTN